MNIAILGTPYSDFGLCSIVDGLLELGHNVYDLSGRGLNYMVPYSYGADDRPIMDIFIAADTDNYSAVYDVWEEGRIIPKVVLHLHDRWTDYLSVPNSPLKPIHYNTWRCHIAFVRDWDGETPVNGARQMTYRQQLGIGDRRVLGYEGDASVYPVYPMEFAIESRFMEACPVNPPATEREFEVCFFGTLTTARRQTVIEALDREFKGYFGGSGTFTEPDDKWSRWVNGRYVHAPKYYQALSNTAFALSPLGAGPSCGRTYEAYAAGCIPLIQRYPSEIKQIVPFVDGENCILWESKEELIPKVRNLLGKRQELLALQERCYEFGQKHLLSRHRAQFILDKMEEHNLLP